MKSRALKTGISIATLAHDLETGGTESFLRLTIFLKLWMSIPNE
jgi:hypothetical protein